MRARVIGTGGKTRRIIEDHGGVNLSVYGDTVAIIGNSSPAADRRTAVDMVLPGSEHATVYRYLERKPGQAPHLEMGFELDLPSNQGLDEAQGAFKPSLIGGTMSELLEGGEGTGARSVRSLPGPPLRSRRHRTVRPRTGPSPSG